MRWISISEAQVGFVLGEPVLDSNGRILAKKGESLSSDLLNLIHAAGIKEIFATEITGSAGLLSTPVAASGHEDDGVANEVRRKLDLRFRRYPDHPVMKTLRHLAEKHLIQAKSPALPN